MVNLYMYIIVFALIGLVAKAEEEDPFRFHDQIYQFIEAKLSEKLGHPGKYFLVKKSI